MLNTKRSRKHDVVHYISNIYALSFINNDINE